MDDLWARWRAFYEEHGIRASQICVDGIVDPARFAAAPKRILFVLREVNDWPGGDLRPFLAAGPRYQTWHNVARWAAGLLDGWPPYDVVDRFDRMHDALRQIAAINLKKTTGGSVADLSVVNAFAAHDRELLVEQIERIGPQIIVACGTFATLAPRPRSCRDRSRIASVEGTGGRAPSQDHACARSSPPGILRVHRPLRPDHGRRCRDPGGAEPLARSHR